VSFRYCAGSTAISENLTAGRSCRFSTITPRPHRCHHVRAARAETDRRGCWRCFTSQDMTSARRAAMRAEHRSGTTWHINTSRGGDGGRSRRPMSDACRRGVLRQYRHEDTVSISTGWGTAVTRSAASRTMLRYGSIANSWPRRIVAGDGRSGRGYLVSTGRFALSGIPAQDSIPSIP